jgi:hypothetical protein
MNLADSGSLLAVDMALAEGLMRPAMGVHMAARLGAGAAARLRAGSRGLEGAQVQSGTGEGAR